MADEKQLSILRERGVEAWNWRWRWEAAEEQIDLSGADLHGADLNGAILREADLSGAEVSDNYKVGLTISVEASFLGLAKAGLKTDDSWTWTNTSSTSNTAGSTQTAQVTVTGPSFGYQGSTDMEVFYDAVYKTFAFSPVDTTVPLAFKGRLLASNGTPAPFQRISAVAGGVTYHTFSNSRGEYRFAGQLRGPVTVKSGSKVLATLRAVAPSQELQLKLH